MHECQEEREPEGFWDALRLASAGAATPSESGGSPFPSPAAHASAASVDNALAGARVGEVASYDKEFEVGGD